MGQRSALGSLLFLLGLYGICTGFRHENCSDYKLQFERVFSVPGDVAMLNSTLVSSDVFNFSAEPHNISWYDSRTGREMRDQNHRVLVRGQTLWFLNTTLEDSGEYVTLVRTASRCYVQATKLVVETAAPGECGRPRKAPQTLVKGVTDFLYCPLKEYISKLESYNIPSSITWYLGCEPIVDGDGKYTYMAPARLKIDQVDHQSDPYTCTLSFTLGGVQGSVSETIEAHVTDKYAMIPQVHEPANETIKAQMGSNFTKRCRVFVPCIGKPLTDIVWMIEGNFILNLETSDRIYTTVQRPWRVEAPSKGVWLERLLVISELREEDFHINYTCQAFSARGFPQGYFTLLPADPNVILPIGSVLGGMMLLFIITVTVYYLFKVDIVLWFRRAFPVFYANTDLDGKLYDAYVAYPQPGAVGFGEKVEAFALHTLPLVLEKACGYKLFIAGRDCTPGTTVVDSVEENIQASRRLLLLYNASTFISKRHTSSTSSNNNNITKTRDGREDGQTNNNITKTRDGREDGQTNNNVTKTRDGREDGQTNNNVTKTRDGREDGQTNNNVTKTRDGREDGQTNNNVTKTRDGREDGQTNNNVTKTRDGREDGQTNNNVTKTRDGREDGQTNNNVTKTRDGREDGQTNNNVTKTRDGREDGQTNNNVTKTRDGREDGQTNNNVTSREDGQTNNNITKTRDGREDGQTNNNVTKTRDGREDGQTNNNVTKTRDGREDGQTNNNVTKTRDGREDGQTNNNVTSREDGQTNNNITKTRDGREDGQTNNNVTKTRDGREDGQTNNNITSREDGQTNNNVTKSSDSSSILISGVDGGEDVYPGDGRQQLECVAAMHRALLEGSLKVILVELEKISPAQLALFPESVRHLRKKQGAVRWWKNTSTGQSWRTCTRTCRRTRQDEEEGGRDAPTPPPPCLSPSSRFWKEMRYRMPVRGKRAAYPERTALLTL